MYIPKKLHVRKAGSDRKCAGKVKCWLMVWCFQDMFNEHSLGFQHDKAIHEENGMSKRRQKTPYTQLSRPTDMVSQVLETNCPATIQMDDWERETDPR